MEPGTGLAILGSALGGARIIEKILGPTAEYIGAGVKNWTERRVNNVVNIFLKAEKKLGDRIEEPGSIPPRVLKVVLDEGSFCNDSLVAEYFGGVLASSRSQVDRDDRGASWSNLVARLSSYQVRSHFLIYRAIYDRFHGQDFTFTTVDRDKLLILLPFSSYQRSMEFSESEIKQFNMLLSHSLFGLDKEGLIEKFAFGAPKNLRTGMDKEGFHTPAEGGIRVTPSPLGAELFLWAHGHGNLGLPDLLHLELNIPDGIVPCATALSIEDLKNKNTEQDD